MKKHAPPPWRHKRLIELLGVPEQARRTILQAGFAPPSRSNISMWRSRETISSDWAPAVVLALIAAGKLQRFEDALRMPIT